MNAGWPNAVARRIGLGGEIDFTTTRIGQTLHVPCRGRGRHKPHIVDVEVAPGQHPDAIAKKMLHMGWKIGSRLLCPDAYTKQGRETPVQEPEVRAATPTPAAGRAKRLVYMALEDYYDEARKAYKPGHSDASIAKDCNVAEAVVRQIREEAYGPLAMPNELTAFQEQIEKLKREIARSCEDHKAAAKELESQLATIVMANGWKKP